MHCEHISVSVSKFHIIYVGLKPIVVIEPIDVLIEDPVTEGETSDGEAVESRFPSRIASTDTNPQVSYCSKNGEDRDV